MAVVTLQIASQSNLSPSIVGDLSISLSYNELYAFTLADFTTIPIPAYSDPEADPLEEIKILSLPSFGTLTLSSVPVSINDTITSAQLTASNLEYQCDPGDTDGYNDLFTYTVSDTGSSTFSIDTGNVAITVAAQIGNLPPTEVGDGTMTLDYGETGVFTRAMFTSATTPPYSDPEGDPALYLKVLSLPILGTIKINGVDVTINDIIDFNDIDSGLLTYVPDLADTDGDLQGFTFSVADISGIFVE